MGRTQFFVVVHLLLLSVTNIVVTLLVYYTTMEEDRKEDLNLSESDSVSTVSVQTVLSSRLFQSDCSRKNAISEDSGLGGFYSLLDYYILLNCYKFLFDESYL